CQQFNHGDRYTEMLILFCLLSMRLHTSIAEYNASVRPCATMAQAGGSVAPKRPLRREGISAIAKTSFLASTVVFSCFRRGFFLLPRNLLHASCIATPATQRQGKCLC